QCHMCCQFLLCFNLKLSLMIIGFWGTSNVIEYIFFRKAKTNFKTFKHSLYNSISFIFEPLIISFLQIEQHHQALEIVHHHFHSHLMKIYLMNLASNSPSLLILWLPIITARTH
ncbi:hypothetical protein ACJX0J_014315, partial [Zea mays]